VELSLANGALRSNFVASLRILGSHDSHDFNQPTHITVPVLPHATPRECVQIGRVGITDTLMLASDAVHLFSAYGRLSPEERALFDAAPTGAPAVLDELEMPDDVPEHIRAMGDMSSPIQQEFMRTFDVVRAAQRVFGARPSMW